MGIFSLIKEWIGAFLSMIYGAISSICGSAMNFITRIFTKCFTALAEISYKRITLPLCNNIDELAEHSAIPDKIQLVLGYLGEVYDFIDWLVPLNFLYLAIMFYCTLVVIATVTNWVRDLL